VDLFGTEAQIDIWARRGGAEGLVVQINGVSLRMLFFRKDIAALCGICVLVSWEVYFFWKETWENIILVIKEGDISS
jgi:hypothetical protein